MRRDWRDTVQVATDLALLGLVVTAAALPLLTAGAAVAAGSAAVHHHLEHDRWPSARRSWAVFRRGLVPGLLAGPACAAAAALVVVDLLAVRRGAVPGGTPLLVLTAVLVAAAAGYAGLTVVAVGAHPGRPWRAAARRVPLNRALPAAAGVLALAGVLAVLVHPVLVPVLAGYALFALHVVARRFPVRTGEFLTQ
ncbi:hypothetical protein ACFQFC_40655 [Amorphoplanes digitatis]|uniref:DUF624 domain-containing protein n=1 Tax=Actinoplanes digitatis TaxID=1868 RepID=A0A7W7MPT8_9ACTN|nr:hypothetical protein [Actinoplanes digitatis]MBB4762486.1 hypothetical protein [Actinoplanes digitatis]BFE71327.1 hypothetical protein GCM10020092_046280 [Actinoplanes digitatis]GID92388.1 hypothetical protein Adi01nite_18000 [Actinoplanes digitatis]